MGLSNSMTRCWIKKLPKLYKSCPNYTKVDPKVLLKVSFFTISPKVNKYLGYSHEKICIQGILKKSHNLVTLLSKDNKA